METIYEFKELLRKIKHEVLVKSNRLEYNREYYGEIFLVSVEEDIALWKKGRAEFKDYCYFYTDLEGNLLFSGEKFKYATPFSNGRACINNYREWLILDIERKEIVSFPPELIFGNINRLRNDSITLFDKNIFKWGSIKYNPNELTFEQDIPFIWDALDFSRVKKEVYVGIHNITSINDNNPYFNWSDDFGTMFTIGFMRLPHDNVKDLICYSSRKKMFASIPNQKVIKYMHEKINANISKEEREKLFKSYLSIAYNISDYYFFEEYDEQVNNNENKIINVGNIDVYQRKLGKLFK